MTFNIIIFLDKLLILSGKIMSTKKLELKFQNVCLETLVIIVFWSKICMDIV